MLEIATLPCPNLNEAAGQLRELRTQVRACAEELGLEIGAAGTHPSALYQDQKIVEQERARLAGFERDLERLRPQLERLG